MESGLCDSEREDDCIAAFGRVSLRAGVRRQQPTGSLLVKIMLCSRELYCCAAERHAYCAVSMQQQQMPRANGAQPRLRATVRKLRTTSQKSGHAHGVRRSRRMRCLISCCRWLAFRAQPLVGLGRRKHPPRAIGGLLDARRESSWVVQHNPARRELEADLGL